MGLWFKCDERWSFNHICKNKEVRLILIEDNEEERSETLTNEEQLMLDVKDP